MSSSSFKQILKSSAIVGGAQAIDLIIRMVRIKLVAILLGPSGVGLLGLYQSTIEWLGKLSGLGIRSSAVRLVAEANGKGDPELLGRTIKVLRRACWVTGLSGWLITVLIAKPLCIWTFGNSERIWIFSFLGLILLLESVSAGQTALLQGMRRIEFLARVMILSAIAGTFVSVVLYAWLGEQGIVAALVASAAANLFFSWWFSRQVITHDVHVQWRHTVQEALPLIALGFAFMWAGILTSGVAFATRGLIIKEYGIDASGIYQAAWGISGLFAGFILNAMSQDFYPRLTAAADDNVLVNRLVNEQSEIGILLALPGLIATLAFSPLVIKIFYTSKFVSASDMLPWFVLGIFGRIVAWPLGFIQLAKGASTVFAVSETIFNALHFAFIWLGLHYIGLTGVAIAFAVAYACYSLLVFSYAVKLSGFQWSGSVIKLILLSIALIGAEFIIVKTHQGIVSHALSLSLVLVCGIFCLQQLIFRVGPEHRISKIMAAVPFFGGFFSNLK